MSWLTILLMVAGLGILILGAELLVRGASHLALAAGVTPLLVGLTVVSFGTSAPELAISMQSALSSQAGANIAIGNVVGSNIANILLILGIAAAITPLVVARQLIRLDVPIMIGVSLLMYGLAIDGSISRLDGGILFAGLIVYLVFAGWFSRRDYSAAEKEYEEHVGRATVERGMLPTLKMLGLVAIGLAMLVIGARWMVSGATEIATFYGVSDLVIGLTIVAVGTSLPEVAATTVAALRGERDIAVGNAIGSNLFNILSVLGLTALVAPQGVQVAGDALAFDIPIMIVVAIACLPIFFTNYSIDRWEGWLFLGYYMAYIVFLVLSATGNAALPMFEGAMIWFALPLTTLTLVVLAVRALMASRRSTSVNAS